MRNATTTGRNFLVVLDVTDRGTVYLGRLGTTGPLQGVQRLENASRYTERGARQLAAQYPRAVATAAR